MKEVKVHTLSLTLTNCENLSRNSWIFSFFLYWKYNVWNHANRQHFSCTKYALNDTFILLKITELRMFHIVYLTKDVIQYPISDIVPLKSSPVIAIFFMSVSLCSPCLCIKTDLHFSHNFFAYLQSKIACSRVSSSSQMWHLPSRLKSFAKLCVTKPWWKTF